MHILTFRRPVPCELEWSSETVMDSANMALSTCHMDRGHAAGVVTNIGNHTVAGQIASLSWASGGEDEKKRSHLQTKTKRSF